MSRTLRIILTVAAAIAAYTLVSVALLVALPQETPAVLDVLGFLVSLAVAFGAGRAVWNGPSSPGRPGLLRAVMLGALMVGGLGFLGGFIGPLIFAPGANQGPLLGILVTGPLGVVVGAIGGAFYWLVRRN